MRREEEESEEGGREEGTERGGVGDSAVEDQGSGNQDRGARGSKLEDGGAVRLGERGEEMAGSGSEERGDVREHGDARERRDVGERGRSREHENVPEHGAVPEHGSPREHSAALIELRGVSKFFGTVIALQDVSLTVHAGEVMCLLGDNGAGKSTLIKCLSGVHPPDAGEMLVDGKPVRFSSPREALETGIATVYQDLAMIPLMSIARNFFLGSEPTIGRGLFRRFDTRKADTVTREELGRMGIDVRDTTQPVGTLSGGERQSVAIARAVHFGARVLILDEPTSALGVKEAGIVLKYIARARSRGVGVIFITHNIHHAYPIGDRFTILNRGRSYGTFHKSEISREKMLTLMAGGEELAELDQELEKLEDAGEREDPAGLSRPSANPKGL